MSRIYEIQKRCSVCGTGIARLVVIVTCSVGNLLDSCVPTYAYLRRALLTVRPESVARFLMIRGRSSRQKRGTTPFCASGRPTRCTKHHSSSKSLMSRRVSPMLRLSSSGRLGWKDDVTSMSRGRDFDAKTVVSAVRGAEDVLAID